MSIGMTYNEFWNEDSFLTKTYYQAHLYRIEQRNQEMWVMGMYMCSALTSTVGNMFRDKGSKKYEYFNEPISLHEKSEEEKKIEAEKERQKAIESFKRLQSSMNTKFNGETKCQ